MSNKKLQQTFLLVSLVCATPVYSALNTTNYTPLKIAFVIYVLSFRGMELATYDYAHYNETLLGNESYIINFDAHTDNAVRTKFRNRFSDRLIDCESLEEMQYALQDHKIDILYALKHGYDQLLSTSCPTAVHTVFPGKLKPHGDMFACISPWLCHLFPHIKPAYVPHIVQVADTDEDLRKELNIDKDAMVFGRYGGEESFNVPCTQEAVKEVARQHPEIYFIFLNTREFCDLPNVKYLPKTTDLVYKTKFINTCDALLHARWRGETFGLTCAEFSMKNKPVITWKHSQERAHIDFLGKTGIYYGTKQELIDILVHFKKGPEKNWDVYSGKFTPERVMKQFEAVFIKPLVKRIPLYRKPELQAYQVTIDGKPNPEFLKHLQELFGKEEEIHWVDCQEILNQSHQTSQNNVLLCSLQKGYAVFIIDMIQLLEQDLAQLPTLDQVYRQLKDNNYEQAIIADTLIAYKATNIIPSSFVKAMTVSRLSDAATFACTLTIQALLAAEKRIGNANESEAAIWNTISVNGERFGSRHYHLWSALQAYRQKKYQDAADQFQQLIKQGYIHWRIYWYLVQALHKLSDPRTDDVINKITKLVPSFYESQLFRSMIYE